MNFNALAAVALNLTVLYNDIRSETGERIAEEDFSVLEI